MGLSCHAALEPGSLREDFAVSIKCLGILFAGCPSDNNPVLIRGLSPCIDLALAPDDLDPAMYLYLSSGGLYFMVFEASFRMLG